MTAPSLENEDLSCSFRDVCFSCAHALYSSWRLRKAKKVRDVSEGKRPLRFSIVAVPGCGVGEERKKPLQKSLTECQAFFSSLSPVTDPLISGK